MTKSNIIHKLGPGEILLSCGICIYLVFKYFSTFVASGILIGLFGALYFYLDKANEYWHRKGVPGPKGNFLYGSLLSLFKSVHEFDKKNVQKYGKVFGAVLSGIPDLQVQDPDVLKEVLIKNFDAFPDRHDFGMNVKDNLRSSVLTVKKGDDWRRIRHRITPAFTSGKMKKLLPAMNLCSNEFVKYLEKFAEDGTDVPLKDTFSKLTMNIIGRTVFAADLNSFDESEKSPFLHYAQRLFAVKLTDPAILFMVTFPNFFKLYTLLTGKMPIQSDVFEYFRTSLTEIMDRRLKDPEAPQKYNDAFQLLLNALDDNEKPQITAEDADIISDTVSSTKERKTLSKIEIIGQLFIFLIAGYETTASTLHFLCYVLSQKPDIQEKLRDEILEVLDGRESVDYEDMSKLQYLNQVMCETLRMYPPAVRMNRRCQKDIQVNGIEIEKGTAVSFDIYNIHHDPDLYPDPSEFDPERFSPENKAARHPMAFVPFGAGPRICLGMRFAEFEMRVAVADLIKNYRFLPSEGMPGLPVPVQSSNFLKPTVELKCKVEKI